jgi:arylsulfatase A-like enzyme
MKRISKASKSLKGRDRGRLLRILLFVFSIQAIGVLHVCSNSGSPAGKKSQPNLLFILTDQQRFDAMSCAGNTVLQTPNMDRIAREGVMFKNAYSANPVCVPARAVLLTGFSSVNTTVESNGDINNEDVPDVLTFDRILKNVGYSAEYYGKWHTPYQFTDCYDNPVNPVGNNEKVEHIIRAYQKWLLTKGVEPREPGDGELMSGRNTRPYVPVKLDYNFKKTNIPAEEKAKIKASQSTQYGKVDLPPDISYASYNTEQTLDALERMKDGPFTLTCSFDPPHPPMVIQEPYYSMYPPEGIEVPENINDPMTYSPYGRRVRGGEESPYGDPENIQNMRSIYWGMVREIDDKIGMILDKLDELGLADNTLVIFTSDHGEMLGDHGLHSKSMFYEGAVHVPLLMRFPGEIKAGTVVEEPVSSMDVFPTILDYLEQDAPERDGISLRPFIEGKPVEHDVIAYSTGSSEPNYMIRSGDLKLMIAGKAQNESIDALYDLKNDPLELRNLLKEQVSAKKNQKQAEELKARLVAWMEKHEPNKADEIKKRIIN